MVTSEREYHVIRLKFAHEGSRLFGASLRAAMYILLGREAAVQEFLLLYLPTPVASLASLPTSVQRIKPNRCHPKASNALSFPVLNKENDIPRAEELYMHPMYKSKKKKKKKPRKCSPKDQCAAPPCF